MDAIAKTLSNIAEAKKKTVEGWLVFGRNMNEARLLFQTSADFDLWFAQLDFGEAGRGVTVGERDAAIWAANYPEEFTFAMLEGGCDTVEDAVKWCRASNRYDSRHSDVGGDR